VAGGLVKGEAVEVVIGVLVIWILYAVIRKARGGGGSISGSRGADNRFRRCGRTADLEPLFFKFTPLANSQPHLSPHHSRVCSEACG